MTNIELNDQQVNLIKTLIEETILDDDGFDMTTKTVAKQILDELNIE